MLRLHRRDKDGDPRFDTDHMDSTGSALGDNLSVDDIEQRDSLTNVLLISLRDISSLPIFVSKYPYGSNLTLTLNSWLKSGRSGLQRMAASVLSNLARADDDWARSMISAPDHLHRNLIDILAESTERQHLHLALDFLLQLAKPIGNRAVICQQSFLWAVARHWEGSDVQIQYAATTVLRDLVRDCPSAVRQLLGLVSPTRPEHEDPSDKSTSNVDVIDSNQGFPDMTLLKEEESSDDSTSSTTVRKSHPVQSLWDKATQTSLFDGEINDEGTYLSRMLRLFIASADSKVKHEIQGVVLEICRSMPRLSSAEREGFLEHRSFASPVIGAITQTEDFNLRARGYLALVLIAREEVGLVLVNDIIRHSNVFEHLVQSITGQAAGSVPELREASPEDSSVEQRDTILHSVCDNARWLVKDILESSVSLMRPASQISPPYTSDLLCHNSYAYLLPRRYMLTIILGTGTTPCLGSSPQHPFTWELR